MSITAIGFVRAAQFHVGLPGQVVHLGAYVIVGGGGRDRIVQAEGGPVVADVGARLRDLDLDVQPVVEPGGGQRRGVSRQRIGVIRRGRERVAAPLENICIDDARTQRQIELVGCGGFGVALHLIVGFTLQEVSLCQQGCLGTLGDQLLRGGERLHIALVPVLDAGLSPKGRGAQGRIGGVLVGGLVLRQRRIKIPFGQRLIAFLDARHRHRRGCWRRGG